MGQETLHARAGQGDRRYTMEIQGMGYSGTSIKGAEQEAQGHLRGLRRGQVTLYTGSRIKRKEHPPMWGRAGGQGKLKGDKAGGQGTFHESGRKEGQNTILEKSRQGVRPQMIAEQEALEILESSSPRGTENHQCRGHGMETVDPTKRKNPHGHGIPYGEAKATGTGHPP